MNQLRLNPLTGRWVTVATGRASRPGDVASDQSAVESVPVDPCPFCPGHEEETPPAIETSDAEGDWLLRVIPNRYPAFEGSGSMRVEHLGPVFAKAEATGIHEIVVFTPDHTASWADLDDERAALFMTTLRDRMEDHSHAPGVRYSQAIVNHGRAAGASLVHPHGQLIGIPFVPGELTEEIAGFRRFSGGCLMCATVEAEQAAGYRLVADTDAVTVITPWWSATPFELLIVPTSHEGHIRKAAPADISAVGCVIRDALKRLRELLGDVSYNVVVHTLPHQADDPFHWHIHLLPRVHTIGGFEKGTGVPINIVSPEDACKLLISS